MPVLNESPQILISSSANVLPFIKYCEKQKVDWLSIAHKSGIKRDLLMSSEWYMSRDLMRFVQLLSLETTQTLGIDVAMESTLNEIAPDIARLVANVGSLEQALSIVIESMNVLNSHVKFWAERIDGHWFICHMASIPKHAAGFSQAEWYRTGCIIQLCRHFYGQNWFPNEIRVAGDYTPDVVKRLRAVKHIEFGEPFGAILVGEQSHFDPVDQYAETMDWQEATFKLLSNYALLPNMSIERFCHVVGLSKRTLQRRLKENGHSFKQLKEIFRQEEASRLLRETALPIEEIGWKVGYNDLSNFNRAFKGWAGVSPAVYRGSKRHSLA